MSKPKQKPKHSWGQRLLSLLIFGAVLFMTHQVWLPVFGTFLLVPDRVQEADCIVTLRGEEYFRVSKAAELYKEGRAPVIIVSVIPKESQPYDLTRLLSGFDQYNETEVTVKIFEYFGVKKEAVLFTGKETTSTYEEALATKEIMEAKGFRSMLLVTSTYHMRRALWTFHKVFRGTGIEIYPVTGKHVLYEPERWWTRERDVRRLFEEYLSTVFNWVYHFVLKKRSSSFDMV